MTTNGVVTTSTQISGSGLYGRGPASPLTLGPDGAFYGTLNGGIGTNAIFKYVPGDRITFLHRFSFFDSLSAPTYLTFGPDGALYGAIGPSPFNAGSIFKLSVSGRYSTIYSFTGADGSSPSGRLVFDAAGDLYGITQYGGSSGSGTLFKLTGVLGTGSVPEPAQWSLLVAGFGVVGGMIRKSRMRLLA